MPPMLVTGKCRHGWVDRTARVDVHTIEAETCLIQKRWTEGLGVGHFCVLQEPAEGAVWPVPTPKWVLVMDLFAL